MKICNPFLIDIGPNNNNHYPIIFDTRLYETVELIEVNKNDLLATFLINNKIKMNFKLFPHTIEHIVTQQLSFLNFFTKLSESDNQTYKKKKDFAKQQKEERQKHKLSSVFLDKEEEKIIGILLKILDKKDKVDRNVYLKFLNKLYDDHSLFSYDYACHLTGFLSLKDFDMKWDVKRLLEIGAPSREHNALILAGLKNPEIPLELKNSKNFSEYNEKYADNKINKVIL